MSSMSETQREQLVMDALTGVAPEIAPETLQRGINFRDQFELDSVDYMDFVLTLERALEIRIPEQDYPRLSCLTGCLTYLAERLDPPAP